MTSRRKSNTGLIIIVSIFLCAISCACILGIYFLSNGDILSIFTPATIQVLDTPLPFPTIIALTFSAAGTQTAIVSNPASLTTLTPTASIEDIPTATIFIFQLQTDVAQPTEYIYSTNTPFSLTTQLPPAQSTSTLPPQSAVCSCASDTLNCGNFNTQSQAQACYTYCVSQGRGDIHNLDGDGNGLACESLP